MPAPTSSRRTPRRPGRLDRILAPVVIVLGVAAAVLVALALSR